MERDEERAREALYGPQTRSGDVDVVEAPLTTPEAWIDWDAIRWDWPIRTEIRMDRSGCDY